MADDAKKELRAAWDELIGSLEQARDAAKPMPRRPCSRRKVTPMS